MATKSSNRLKQATAVLVDAMEQESAKRRAVHEAYRALFAEQLPGKLKALRKAEPTELIELHEYAIRLYDRDSKLMSLYNEYKDAVRAELLRRISRAAKCHTPNNKGQAHKREPVNKLRRLVKAAKTKREKR